MHKSGRYSSEKTQQSLESTRVVLMYIGNIIIKYKTNVVINFEQVKLEYTIKVVLLP